MKCKQRSSPLTAWLHSTFSTESNYKCYLLLNWHCGNVSLCLIIGCFTRETKQKKIWQTVHLTSRYRLNLNRCWFKLLAHEFVYSDYLCVAQNSTEYKIKRYIYPLRHTKSGRRVLHKSRLRLMLKLKRTDIN